MPEPSTPPQRSGSPVSQSVCESSLYRQDGVTHIYSFLISTHYTKYDYTLFGLNFAALVFVLFPKLPSVRAKCCDEQTACSLSQLHRLRIHFLPYGPNTDVAPTPNPSGPPSPMPGTPKARD